MILRSTTGYCVLFIVLTFLVISCSKPPEEEIEETDDGEILMAKTARPISDIKYESSAKRLSRGKYLTSSLWCSTCHTACDTTKPGWPPLMEKQFSGALRYKTDSTHLYAPNLTPDKETGIGNFSDDMIGRAIREGIGHDGRALEGPALKGMPWPSLRNLTDEDLASIIVYLRSIPAIKNKIPRRKLGIEREAILQSRGEPLDTYRFLVNFDDPVSRGTYFIMLADCRGCHRGNIRRTGILGGGEDFVYNNKRVVSPNLTSDETGVGSWTEETFISVLRNGKGKSGEISHHMPWVSFRNFSDEDLSAIYQALMTSFPVKHLVLNSAPPSYCEVCEHEHGLGNVNHIEPLNPFRKDYKIPNDLAGEFIGSVRKQNTLNIFYRDEHLALKFNNSPEELEMIPLGEDKYLVLGISPLEFIRNSDGKVTSARFQLVDTFTKVE